MNPEEEYERKMWVDDLGANSADLRPIVGMGDFAVADPTEPERSLMLSRGPLAFRVPIRQLHRNQFLVDEPRVRSLVAAIRGKGVAALRLPIYVMLSEGKLVVDDGHHRVAALLRLGRKTALVAYHPMYLRK